MPDNINDISADAVARPDDSTSQNEHSIKRATPDATPAFPLTMPITSSECASRACIAAIAVFRAPRTLARSGAD